MITFEMSTPHHQRLRTRFTNGLFFALWIVFMGVTATALAATEMSATEVSATEVGETANSINEAQTHQGSAAKDVPLFADDSRLTATLRLPLSQIYSEKGLDERVYHEALFSYKESDEVVRLPVKVKTRGNFRRANCVLPPLRLNFPKKQMVRSIMEGQDKIKLVGPCQLGGVYRQLVDVERVAYEIYELVSDYAFQTRALDMNYVDNAGRTKPRTFSTFVIESHEGIEDRFNVKRVKAATVKTTQLDPEVTAVLEVFAYFIGNTDYSTLLSMNGDRCCHNVMLFEQSDPAAPYIPVPYDFDMSGFVDPPYGAPSPQVPIQKLTQRLFRGWCKDEQHIDNAIQRFVEKRDDIMRVIDNADGLSDWRKKIMKSFIEGSYKRVADAKAIEKNIKSKCRG